MKTKSLKLRTKLQIALMLLSFILILGISITGGLIYRRRMEEQYSNAAFETATIVSNLIDGDRIAKYRNTLEKDDYYEQARATLQMVRRNVGVKYLYVVIPEENQFYIWDTGEEGDEGVCDLGDTDDFYGDGYEIMHKAFQPNAEKTILITTSDVYGYLASAYVAILDSNGQPAALASVDVSLDEINQEIRQFYLMILGASVVIIALFSVLYFRYLQKALIKPINMLAQDTSRLVSDQMEALDSFQNRIHSGDELQSLGESFERMTRDLSKYIQNLANVTAEKERIGAELNIATKIQADMLPRIFPPYPNRSEFELYATMDPAKEVGGDFYDFFLVDDDHIGLVIADVSGKGVPAALFMVIAKTLIKNRAMTGESPAEIMNHLNEQLFEGNEAEYFVTVWMAIIQISTGKGVALNAGHEHPALRRKDGVYELQIYRHSPPVATVEGVRFRQHDFELAPGDELFVYTDGVAEATDIHNELFGAERMVNTLNQHLDETPEQQLRAMKQSIDDFVGEAPQFDDITMLCFRYLGPNQ